MDEVQIDSVERPEGLPNLPCVHRAERSAASRPTPPAPSLRARWACLTESGPRLAGRWLIALAAAVMSVAAPAQGTSASATPATSRTTTTEAPPAEVDPAKLLDSARRDMDAIRSLQDDTLDDAATLQLRKRALSAQTRAEEAASALEPELADVKARLTQIGEPADGVKESPEVAAQRAQLMRNISTLDSQIKLARLLALEAEQAAATALENRRMQFSARLGERAPSVLGSRFWQALADDGDDDLQRLRTLGGELGERFAAVTPSTWLLLAGAAVVWVLAHLGLRRLLAHLSATRLPSGRLRRSLHATGVVMLWTLSAGLLAHGVALALTAGPGPAPRLADWLDSVEAILWFGAFVGALGTALLMPRKPSWRLPPVPDLTATRLAWFPQTLAATVVVGWVSVRSVATLDASVSFSWAVNGLSTLTHLGVLALALSQAQRRTTPRPGGDSRSDGHGEGHGNTGAGSHNGAQGDAHGAASARPLWLSVLRAGAWIALAASALAVLSGFVALGTFIMNQLVWGLIVLSTAYLLTALVDDLFMSLLAPTAKSSSPEEAAAEDASAAPAKPRTREQTAVLLSAVCRVMVGVFALVLLLAPYGEGPVELFRRAGRLHEGLSIGELSLRPMALLQGALIMLLGFGAVRLLKTWLAQRYMPTTRMDAGMRMSVTTLFGYIGAVAVIAVTMSALGVGLERVAWVASALSVGIGFGLQAVVQNFVSGLILLAERPVKVGDWVSLSGVEGDIRRINVRATEIQMGDRSTVIVPNSEFITKIVRNVTYGDSLGMVQFKLPMPLSSDTARARALLLEAFTSHPGVLSSPPPSVQLDGIDGTNFVLNATGFVNSPRAAYAVKSDLLLDVLTRLRAAGLLPTQPVAG
ncbi:DUF3772 domain-containing protein [Roseateles amylovorans]|uniref:DUF3772 domain-containing protein n=1 Tax=Roseateles amylovorans TaxID=2978473 RepID=A0ABY6B235_9BURK|nr:DUF3772 domain-containing protein [Roseateles amylovorans]UXH79136.1 DUF3772 domain-containing protein [Roseateles amylovorans]